MLLELKVTNFAIIDNIHIQFRSGLNILTGETGAGKSVLLKSLGLLMGLKGSTESIRSGFQQASIEGSFDLSHRADLRQRVQDLGIELEEQLLVVKRVLAEDKSRVYINGSLSTLNTLRDLVAPLIEVAGHSSSAAPLIEMTSQFDNRNLLSKSYHMDLLDQSAQTWDLRREYSARFSEWQKVCEEIQKLRSQGTVEQQRLDFLRFQRDEIQALDLRENEDQEIEAELRRMKNSSRWLEFINQAEMALASDADAATVRLNGIVKKAQDFTSYEPRLEGHIQTLRQAHMLIEDAVFEMRRWTEELDSEPGRLETLESRLSQLRKLQKKYGQSVTQIRQACEAFAAEIHQLENRDLILADLEKKEAKMQEGLRLLAQTLHTRREAQSSKLAKAVNEELAELNMKGVRFAVQLQALRELTATGLTEVEFMTQNSSKDPMRPLAKFASGGELSRVLLSLKRVVGSSDLPRTYLFDEVDTGVSGPTAEKVGRKLRSIAEGQQVICITHLPQVAAFASAHFYIHKSSAKRVAMEVVELSGAEKVGEIARLISGEKVTKTSLAHAKELISEARPH